MPNTTLPFDNKTNNLVEKSDTKETYALFAGRHELPPNLGAICDGFNFENFKADRSKLWKKAVISENCQIIVTGLTPALTEFISAWVNINIRDNYASREKSLTLLHYNSDKKEYIMQEIF